MKAEVRTKTFLSETKITKNMIPKTVKAIFVSGKKTDQERWYKYRSISTKPYSLQKFVEFAKKKGANEINLYNSENGLFWQKIVIVDR